MPAVDALRGLALFAILIANIPFSEAISSATFIFGYSSDQVVNALFHLLIDKKFVAIFSILFGFGFYYQLKRAEDRGIDFRKYFIVRMLLLQAIGCLHAYLLWFGDIIRDYALCGLLLLLIYKWPPGGFYTLEFFLPLA